MFAIYVSGYVSNNALAVEAMLATASIGAVWSSTSPEFGVSVSENKLHSFIQKIAVIILYSMMNLFFTEVKNWCRKDKNKTLYFNEICLN